MEPGQLHCTDRVIVPDRVVVRGLFVREGSTGRVVEIHYDLDGKEVDTVVLDDKSIELPFRPSQVEKL